VKYLLDVNALIAWRHARSPHHAVFHSWAARVGLRELVTCAHCELGFIRVSMQVFGYTVEEAQSALDTFKVNIGGFVAEAPSPRLPAWASTAAKTSDGYLMQIAAARRLQVATFDAAIKDAELIRI
jgi:predicted nucleic acid-binding protein